MNDNQLQERIWRIADGVPLKMGNMTIQTSKSDKLLVTGWTNTVHFENINKSSVLKELEELKLSFTNLTQNYDDLNTIIDMNHLTVEFHMTFDDSGKVGIGLCSELKGELNWYL
jgi:NAD-dependent SIR2 family protein deacetylase